jgi:CRP-like cAMP-binding protein
LRYASGVSDPFALFGPLSPPARAALEALCTPRTYGEGDWLLRAGERAEWIFLVTEGLVRELYVSDDGDEHTRSFIPAGHATGSLLDLVSGAPAITWIQALEPTQTIAFRYAAFDALTARFPELAKAARRNAEQLAVRKTRREHEMLALTAAQRYARWLAEQTSLDARISRRLLASYLGVTPEHLSRLRRAHAAPAPRRSRSPRRR